MPLEKYRFLLYPFFLPFLSNLFIVFSYLVVTFIVSYFQRSFRFYIFFSLSFFVFYVCLQVLFYVCSSPPFFPSYLKKHKCKSSGLHLHRICSERLDFKNKMQKTSLPVVVQRECKIYTRDLQFEKPLSVTCPPAFVTCPL